MDPLSILIGIIVLLFCGGVGFLLWVEEMVVAWKYWRERWRNRNVKSKSP